MKRGYYFMKNVVLEEIFEKRIKANTKLFAEKELELIRKNKSIAEKLYMLGIIDGKEIYKEKV